MGHKGHGSDLVTDRIIFPISPPLHFSHSHSLFSPVVQPLSSCFLPATSTCFPWILFLSQGLVRLVVRLSFIVFMICFVSGQCLMFMPSPHLLFPSCHVHVLPCFPMFQSLVNLLMLCSVICDFTLIFLMLCPPCSCLLFLRFYSFVVALQQFISHLGFCPLFGVISRLAFCFPDCVHLTLY